MDSLQQGMRRAARRALGFIVLSGFAAAVPAAPQLSISPLGYRIESALLVQNAPRTYEVVARAAITNTADRAVNVMAQLSSSTSGVVVTDGAVSFGDVPRTSPLRPQRSIDTFSVRFVLPDSRNPGSVIEFLQKSLQGLSWTISCDNCAGNRPPLAHAGSDQTAFLHQTVTLDGSGSSDPDGDALTFEWTIVSRPAASGASLSDPSAVRPQLTLDVAGAYVLALVVSDGKSRSAQATVTVTTRNSPPVARAGADQTTLSGARVQLDGSASSDVDGDALSYEWSLVQRPEASAATIEGAESRSPLAHVVVDRPGQYVAQLVVTDGSERSAPDSTVISTINSTPVAQAGPDTTARVGERVELSAIGSSDADGDALTYRWALTAPVGSAVTLSSPTARDTSFVVDRPGTYVVQLIVNDSSVDSAADTLVVSTVNSRPVAVAGTDVATIVGERIALDGGQSHDVDGDALAYSWSMLTQPQGSAAVLETRETPLTAFVPDVAGLYVLQLIVSDGSMSSEPSALRVLAEAPPDRTGPAISITSPADGVVTNAVSIRATGSLDEPGTLEVNASRLQLDQTYRFDVLIPLAEGWNELRFVATDGAGNQTLASRQVLRDSIPPTAAATALIRITIADEAALSIAGMPNAVEAGATIRIVNASTGASVLVVADTTGAFQARIAGTSADTLRITVIDGAGNESAQIAVTAPASAGIRLDVLAPVDGAGVDGNTVLVAGTLHAPADTGLAMNGRAIAPFGVAPARQFAAMAALSDGENTLMLVAQRPDGTRIEQTLRVTRTGDSPFSVIATPGSAVTPAAVTFTIEQHAPETISHVEADFDGDGTPELSSFDEVQVFAHTYDAPGVQMPRFRVHTTSGEALTYTVPVTVHAPEDLDRDVLATWEGLLSALAARDTSRASTYVHSSSFERYAEVFDALRDNLPDVLGGFSEPVPVQLAGDLAEYAVTRTIEGVEHAFLIYLVRGADGVWRLSAM